MIFKEDSHNHIFINNGYVVLNNVLQIDFDKQYKYFNSLQSNVESKFYASLWSKDESYKSNINNKILEILQPICDKFLCNYEGFYCDLIIKKPSLNDSFEWHQDWTFVDEDLYSTLFIWAPLQDVHIINGCLKFIKGSHKNFQKIRGSNIPPIMSSKEIEKLYTHNTVPLKKGDVVIFNQAILHSSPPNRSFKNRLALGLMCVPKNIELNHYHYNKEKNRIEKYLIDKDFIMNFSQSQDFKENLYSSNLVVPEDTSLVDVLDIQDLK